MNPKFNIKPNHAVHLLQGLVAVNEAQLKEHIKDRGNPFTIIEAIQNGNLRYKRSDPEEHWQSYNELVELTKNKLSGTDKEVGADCEDLAAAVVAELKHAGIDARIYVYKARTGLYHVIVKTKKWGFLDPSLSAGMGTV